MNEHFHTYMHTRTTGSNPTIVCEFYAGIRNRRSPFHRAHIHPFGVCVYMGDIKAIDAKHFATGYA